MSAKRETSVKLVCVCVFKPSSKNFSETGCFVISIGVKESPANYIHTYLYNLRVIFSLFYLKISFL